MINCAGTEIMEIFACCILLSVVAASSLDASSSTVPVSDSTLIVRFANDSLERPDHWPALPYVYPIDSTYSLYLPEYGDLEPLSQEEVVLAAFLGIEDQLAAEGGSDDQIYSKILEYHGVFVSFQTPTSPTLPFRRGEAVKALRAVRGLMGRYSPRNLPSVKLLLGKDVLAHFIIAIFVIPGAIPSLPLSLVSNNSEIASNVLPAGSNHSLSWPEAPYTLQFEHDLMMTIFDYGPEFAESKGAVLVGLSIIERGIRRRAGPGENLPTKTISAGPVSVTFQAVRFPPLPITNLQAAQVIHTFYHLTKEYGPCSITRAEIYVVGTRAMLFTLGPRRGSENETSFMTLDLPPNDSALPSPALVARSNTNPSSPTPAPDQPWPDLPFTLNVDDKLDVTILEYGTNFPGPRRHVLQALATMTELITRQRGNIMRTQRLAYSPLTMAFYRIPGQGQGVPLMRTQAVMVLRAMETLMRDHKPRELRQTEIYVGGEKAVGLSLKLYFATLDTGNRTLGLGNAASELGSAGANIGTS